jgi:acyl-CoA synthetase (AMP-forming)/AMP-acid ligase II
MQIGDIVRRAARSYGSAPAIVFGDRTLSFEEFDAATDRLGNALLAMGLQPRDRVGILLPNGIEYLIAVHALAKAGFVYFTLNVRDTPTDHEYRIGDAQARALLTADTSFAPGSVDMVFGLDDIERMIADGPDGACETLLALDEPYRLAYTGGTTGMSKGVQLSTSTKLAEISNYLIDLLPDIRPGERMLHAAPITHAGGSFFLPHLLRGACNIILPSFKADDYLEQLQRTQATTTFLVPTMINMVLDDPNVEDVDVRSLRRLCYGASPISPTTAARAQRIFGEVLYQTYGQAEAPMTITYLDPQHHHLEGSAGRPYTLSEVRIFDADDHSVPDGELGEVVVRGPIVMQGYWNRPKESAAALRNGWLHTGDIGFRDDAGFFYLRDRRNDVIISGGFNVYPREVENVLLSHPAVREAAVVSIPDEKWGERVHAVVSTRSPVSSEQLLAYAKERLAGYKRPHGLDIWPELPKSAVGKILRRTVRDQVRGFLAAEPVHDQTAR